MFAFLLLAEHYNHVGAFGSRVTVDQKRSWAENRRVLMAMIWRMQVGQSTRLYRSAGPAVTSADTTPEVFSSISFKTMSRSRGFASWSSSLSEAREDFQRKEGINQKEAVSRKKPLQTIRFRDTVFGFIKKFSILARSTLRSVSESKPRRPVRLFSTMDPFQKSRWRLIQSIWTNKNTVRSRVNV